jgi:hypothetical protein
MLKSFICLLCLSFTFNSFANLKNKFDENNQNLLTENEFNELIDKVYNVYSPIFNNKQIEFKLEGQWGVGRYSDTIHLRSTENSYKIVIGGNPNYLNRDGLILGICYTIGRRLGGSPKYNVDPTNVWKSAYGQADYYATLKCIRKIFRGDNNQLIVSKLKKNNFLKQKCKESFNNNDDRAICIRSGMAALNFANFLAVTYHQKTPRFETPDPTLVTRTWTNASRSNQCRLDSLFRGLLCPVSENEDVSNTNENQGVCSRNRGQTNGSRPLCWYKPSY